MIRLIFWFAVLVAITFAATWLADSPGEFSMVVRGYRVETHSVGVVVLALGLLFAAIWLVWGVFKWIIGRPSAFGGFFSRRRERKGRQALSTGLVAIGAGDDHTAKKAAAIAARLLPDDPLAQLLAAQSAQKQGDSARVKQVYKEMTASEDTKLLGLRGLFNEARREKNIAAARDIAKQALAENPGVSWASNAMLVSYASEKDWPAVLLLLENQLKAKIIDKETANRKKAVALTAQAMEAEDKDPGAALDLATKAHKLDPSLVPAAVIAARTNIAVGSTRKAARILEKTWKLHPHPDIAEVYAHARPGDSASDRLVRIKNLVRGFHGGKEGDIALATAAIEAQDWKTAREALNPHIHDHPSVRVCTLMAEIEQRELGDKGRAREWLARAVHAPRDPAWTSGNYVGEEWMPVSPITGELGTFEWKVPVEGLGYTKEQRDDMAAFLIGDVGIGDKVDAAAKTAEDASSIVALEKPAGDAPGSGEIIQAEVVDVAPVTDKADALSDNAEASEKPDRSGKANEKPSSKAETGEQKADKSPSAKKADSNKADTKLNAADAGEKKEAKGGTHRLPDDPGPKKPGQDKNGESWFG